jgi:hypothetical protein
MRRYLALVAAALLLAGACTSGDDDSDDAADTTTAAEEEVPTGPAPGVTDTAVKVGVTYLDFSAIREVVDVDLGDFEAAYRPLFDDINANGGINGRMIEPVFAPVSPIGPAPAEEACVRLTEDEDVFVVIGYFADEAPTCYLETHQTAIIGGPTQNELLARISVPWFSNEAGDDFQADAVHRFAEDGLIGENLGVFAITTETDILEEITLPALEEAGIEPVDTAVLDAPANDVAAQNAAVAVIAERFRAAGVDQVLIVGSGGLTWANGVEATDYRPQLLLVDRGPLDAFVQDDAGRDLSILDNALGTSIIVPPAETYAEPTMQDCLPIQEAAGYVTPDPATLAPDDQSKVAAAFIACGNVALFRAILEAAGPDLNYGTVQKAGEELGEFTIPGTPEPFRFGPPPSTDGDPTVYVFEWDVATTAFVLRGGE